MAAKKTPVTFDPWGSPNPHSIFIGTAGAGKMFRFDEQGVEISGPSPGDESTVQEPSPEPCFRFRFLVAEYQVEFGSPYGKGWDSLPTNLAELARRCGEVPPAFLDALICYPKDKPDYLELLGWDSAEGRTAWSKAFTPFEDAESTSVGCRP